MKRLRRPHLFPLAVVAAAIAVSPAAALAAGEESSEGASSPASTGWVPQGSGSESTGNETTSVRHGSSLGSGASPNQTQPASSETSYTPPSSSSYEAPSSVSSGEESASVPQTGTGTSVNHPVAAAPVVKYAPVGLGAGVRVSAPEPTPVADTKPAAPAPAEPVAAASHDQVSSGSGPNPLTSLALLALIVGGIVLAYVVRRELRAGQAMPRGTYLRH